MAMTTISTTLVNLLSPFFPTKTTPKFPTQNPLSQTLSTSQHKNTPTAILTSKKEDCPGDLMAVVCPSLAYSNTLYFNSSYNVQVLVDDNEPEERLLNRFRREVMRAGVIQECKRRRYFENKQDEKKRRTRDAAKRNSRRRRAFQPRVPFGNKEETTKVDKKDDDGDNWEMPEGGLPF